MLELRDITFTYPGRRLGGEKGEVLGGVTLEVGDGEIVALLGPNGAGKSTLLAIANGSLGPHQGEVLFDGRSISGLSRREVARRMALVAQPAEMRFGLTALEYVLAGRYAHAGAIGFDSPRDIEIALESLALTDCSGFRDRPFNHLSSGERQRVVLARALAQQPRLLLLDEPTASLDPSATDQVEQLIRDIRASGCRVLMTSHNLGQTARLADEVVFIHRGRLLERQPAAAFFERPRTREARDFLQGELPWQLHEPAHADP